MALVDGDIWEVLIPPMNIVDHRGAGDSMTAGIAAALARGKSMNDALQFGAAAGAVNVTRRGLATGQPDLIAKMVENIRVRRMTEPKGQKQ